MHTVLLGIDVGTTTLKTLVFDPTRREVLAVAKAPTPVVHPRPAWSECDPQRLWEGVRESVCLALGQLSGRVEVAALAVSSLGESGVAVEAGGEPLHPIILYYDPRGAESLDYWEREVGAERLHAVTGQVLRPIFAANKLLWLREHEPEVWGRLSVWLSVGDYVISRLCGRRVTDWTLASRTMLFDQSRRTWSDELIGRVGLRADQLPELAPSGTLVGGLSAWAAGELHLPAGVPVVTGGHDHLCAALSCGVIGPGDWFDSIGTAAAVLTLAPDFNGGGEGFRAGFSCYPHVVPGAYVVQGGLSAAGAALAWLSDLTGAGVEELLAEAQLSPPGAGGLIWLPFFRGTGTPHRDVRARGTLIGLSTEHRRGDLMRALCEGLAYWVRENVAALESLTGTRASRLRMSGGVNQHPLMGQLTADILGCETMVAAGAESAALGAALLAGMGVGRFASAGEAAGAAPLGWDGYRPDSTHCNRYHGLYVEAYAPLYQMLRPIFDRLAR